MHETCTVSCKVWVTIRLITKQSDTSEVWKKNWDCTGFADGDCECCGVWGGSPSPRAESDRISGLP
jgi:hypothetical protein